MHRRLFVQALSSAAAVGTWMPLSALAQGLAQVKILYGWPAGGSGDNVARRVADKLAGTPFSKGPAYVDNKPGAGGRIALDTLKSAPADGSVLALMPVSMFGLNPLIFKTLNYKSTDVAPVSIGAVMMHGLAVGPAVPASVQTLKDFLAWCQANPAKASFGSPAAGSMPHLLGALLGLRSGTALQHVAYRGTVPSLADLVGGQIAATMNPCGDYLQYVKAGKIRVLATSGHKRLPYLPDVPTFAESGFPDVTAEEWFGFYAPAKTPAATLTAAHAAINAALADKTVIDSISAMGLVVRGGTAEDMRADEQAMLRQWGPLIQQIGFTADS
jgi:tripartite-type tricarboxylate transporter receptor subunit TctC